MFGGDEDPRSPDHVRRLAATLAPQLPPDNFRAEAHRIHVLPDAFADLVISSAVLHFARDDNQFRDMLQGTWRVLRPAGLLFFRLASSIGMEHQVLLLSDGSERYLVDEALLTRATNDLGGEWSTL